MRFIFSLLIIVSAVNAFTQDLQTIRLSDKAEISVLTCSAGENLYSSFGHTAIRVYDPIVGLDETYNYGTFSFRTEGFYIKFLRRTLDFKLDRTSYEYFEKTYRRENRSVKEQILNLNQQQKQNIFTALEINNLEENRYYRYDHFFDNCATRVRDMVFITFDDLIEPDYSFIDSSKSFRDLITPYLKNMPWSHLGINIGLGSPTDKCAKPYEQMFLPDVQYRILENSLIKGNKPLIKKSQTLFDTSFEQKDNYIPFYLQPLFVFGVILFFISWLSLHQIRKQKINYWFDFALFFITGLLGVLIFFLWFFTEHGVTEGNLNIVWAFPLHLFISFMLFSHKKGKFLLSYIFITGLSCSFLLIGIPFFYQSIDTRLIPIFLIIILRSFTILKVEISKKSRVQVPFAP